MADTLKSTLTDVKGAVKELKKAENEFKKQGKELVSKLKDLIRLSPHIEAIRWSQYTPYFQDGDPCEFGVNELEFKFSEELSGAGDRAANKTRLENYDDSDFYGFGEYSDNDLTKFLNERTDILNFKDIKLVEDVVNAITEIHETLSEMDDILKSVLGDHVQVTVTREGIETEEYEHE